MSKDSPRVTRLIAYWVPALGPLEAVKWHEGWKERIHVPAIATSLLSNDARRDETATVDRTTTEAMAADVTTGTFEYHLVLMEDDPQPVSLIAEWIEMGQPLQAILWSSPDQIWIYAPAVAAQRLYDDQYQDTMRPVDRETAEQIARTALGTELPDEVTLLQMCHDGKATGLSWGPRRS